MKILIIFFLSFLLTLSLVIMLDLMTGIQLSMSIRNLKNPFWVMTIPEYFIVFVLLSIVFVPPIASFFKQRKQAKIRGKS